MKSNIGLETQIEYLESQGWNFLESVQKALEEDGPND